MTQVTPRSITWLKACLCALSLTSVGCASGLLVSEGEELMEQGELREAISRYDEALIKRPAWPRSAEDESEALSALREGLSEKIYQSAQLALEGLRWEEACQAVDEAEYLDGVSPLGPSLKLTEPVLKALKERFLELLTARERWGELELLFRAFDRCQAPSALIEEELARLAVVVTISLNEELSLLKSEGLSPEQAAARWRELERLERRVLSFIERLPAGLSSRWRGALSALRRERLERRLSEALEGERHALAWAYASLLDRPDQAAELAWLARQVSLLSWSAPLGDLLLSQALSPELKAHSSLSPEGAVVSARLLSPPAPQLSSVLSLSETLPRCLKNRDEQTEEQRLLDHYEERPDPEWLKAIVKVEEAQTRYEAQAANLSSLQARLRDERDPLVSARLQSEVDRSSSELKEAERALSSLERAADELPQSLKTPIYALFRYPVTRWTLSCEVSWVLSERLDPLHEDYALSPQPLSSWSVTLTSEDLSHRAYPQHSVKRDPLKFPESEATLRLLARRALHKELIAELSARLKGARELLYRFSQSAEDMNEDISATDLSAARLDSLATLALTSDDPKRVNTLLELLMNAFSADPELSGPLSPLHPEALGLGLSERKAQSSAP